MTSKRHDRPTFPETNSGMKLEAPWFQYLLPFDPNGVEKEVYDHMEFRALHRMYSGNRSSARAQGRKPGTGGAKVHSDPCAGQAIVAARAGAAGGGKT